MEKILKKHNLYDMKYTENEIEIIAKSMYKAVKKTLSNGLSEEARKDANHKYKKDAVEDLMDDNYVAETKQSIPPRKTANMYKSKGVDKLKNFKEKIKTKKEKK